MAPIGTPAAIVNKLNAEINESLKTPEVTATFARLGFDAMINSSQEFAAFLAVQAQKWPPVIKAANIQPQ